MYNAFFNKITKSIADLKHRITLKILSKFTKLNYIYNNIETIYFVSNYIVLAKESHSYQSQNEEDESTCSSCTGNKNSAVKRTFSRG